MSKYTHLLRLGELRLQHELCMEGHSSAMRVPVNISVVKQSRLRDVSLQRQVAYGPLI